MRMTLISAACVLALSLAICILSLALLGGVVTEMDELRVRVMELFEAGDYEAADVRLAQMATTWQDNESMLEIIAQHEDLHTVTTLITEANVDIATGDFDGFQRSMSLLGEALRHLMSEEELRLSNVL